MAFFDGHVEIHPRQFLAKSAHMEVTLNLPDVGQLLLRPGRH